MGSTFDDEITQGGSIFLPYCHAPSYRACPNTELVAGADPHEEQRNLFGTRWGIGEAHLYSDYQEMLEAESIDIVSVCTTARLRPQIVEDAARSGVQAIWAEKPLAFRLDQADSMVGVCRDEGTVLAVNCARRWNPFFIEAGRLIDSRELGKILQVTGYTPCSLSSNGSHAIDTLRFLAGGEVSWVFAEMASDEAAEGEADLAGNAYLAFDNGVRGYLRSTPCGIAAWEFDVVGEKGRVRSLAGALDFEYFRQEPGGPRGRGVPAKYPFPLPATMEGMGLSILRDILSAVETGGKPKCSGDDGLSALEIAIAMRESHRRGGVRVDLPVEDRSLGIIAGESVEDEIPARIRRLQRTK
jgi:predicted dehydrogenase